jgi:ParB family transcriptional regulator, chromosome partitioning protein
LPETVRLLEPHELAEAGPAEAVRLPLDLVDPNPRNPRRSLLEVDALAENIRTFGLLQPVTVRRAGERYELLGGHRRRAAFALLAEQEPHDPQWRSIPAVVRTADDDDRAYLMLLSGQLHARAWHPREEASALERLVVTGRTVRQIGEALHRSVGWASKRLAIYADAVLSGFVQTGQLAPGVAEELLPIKDVGTRKQFAERAVAEHWSQDRARGEARSLRLDKQLREISKRARELVQILSDIDVSRLPDSAARDLWTLHNRVEVLARGGTPVFPTLESARAAAGVRTEPARRQPEPRRPKRKQRVMPRPA